METTDVNTTPAESSSAAPVHPPIEVPQDHNSQEYAEWRLTGKTPESKPAPTEKKPKADPAPAKKEPSEKTAPVSETGNHTQQERRPSKAEARLNDLLEDIRQTGYTPAELKTLRKQAQAETKAEPPKAAPEQTAKPAELKKPKIEDYKTLDEYEAARDKYFEDLAEAKAQNAVQADRIRQANEAQQRDLRERLNKAKERYGEGSDTQIIQTAKNIFNANDVNPAVKAVLNDSDVLVDLMYAIGQGEDFQEFLSEAKTNPGKAIRRAVLMEKLVKEELAKSPAAETPRDSSGKFQSRDEEPPAEKPTTKAPPPPRESSGRASAPPDELQAAIAANDTARYMREANRRDIARRRNG
jgi:hypothetical protein